MIRRLGQEDQRAIAEANRKKQAALNAMRAPQPVKVQPVQTRSPQSLRAFGVEDQAAIRKVQRNTAPSNTRGSADVLERKSQQKTTPAVRGGSADARERQAVMDKYGVSGPQANQIINAQVDKRRAEQGLPPVVAKTGASKPGTGKVTGGKSAGKGKGKVTGGTGTAVDSTIEDYTPGGFVQDNAMPAYAPSSFGDFGGGFGAGSAQQSALTEMQGGSAGGATARGMRISPTSTGRSETKLASPMINRPQAARESTSLLSRSERAYDPTAAYRNLRY